MENKSTVINVIKGIAILLVVFGHMGSPYWSAVYTFHMPLFFFLGGLFINTKGTYRNFLEKNFVRLILPYFLFCIVGYLVNFLKNIALSRPQEPIIEVLIGIFLWGDISHLHHYGLVLWFLPALFWGRFFAFILLTRFHIFMALILAVIIGWKAVSLPILYFSIDKGFMALPWIILGFIFRKFLHNSKINKIVVGIILLSMVLLFNLIFNIEPMDMAYKKFNHVVLQSIFALVCILSIFFILLIYEAKYSLRTLKFFCYFGEATLFILIIHVYTNNISSQVVQYFIDSPNWMITAIFSFSLLTISVYLKNIYYVPADLKLRIQKIMKLRDS